MSASDRVTAPEDHGIDFAGLSAVIFNCTLKPSPKPSHTERLIDIPRAIFTANGVAVEVIRPVDHHFAYGVEPDMTEHGAARDDWPAVWARVKAANILILATPIWLGEESSACRLVIERLYGMSGLLNDRGQSVFYGRTGGALITGNEDGIKHCAMTILFALQHLGFVIPPQADAGWVGEAGPGPSYGDDGAGLDNDFTQRNATFMAWNLMQLSRMLRDAGGIPSHGNNHNEWKAGIRFDNPNPGHR